MIAHDTTRLIGPLQSFHTAESQSSTVARIDAGLAQAEDVRAGVAVGVSAPEFRTNMDFDHYNHEDQFRSAWMAVTIERPVHYSLFTFGDQDLPYFLVTRNGDDSMVTVREGQVNIAKPRIITPDTMHPEFRNFFESEEEYGYVEFLMARTAAFGNLRLTNNEGPTRIVTDTIEEAVARLNRQLDDIEEEHTAILSAPEELAGFAVLKYASERIMSSAPGNVQELRERGFLP